MRKPYQSGHHPPLLIYPAPTLWGSLWLAEAGPANYVPRIKQLRGDIKRRTNVSEYCSRTDKSTAAPGRQAVKNYVTSDTILFWTDKRPILRIFFFTCCTWELNRRLTSSCLEFLRSKAIAFKKFENGAKTIDSAKLLLRGADRAP